ncbi:hypothetical protein [Streptomyces sp. NPDC055140]
MGWYPCPPNTASSGGGIDNRGTLTVAASTILNNTASSDAGGGIFNSTLTATANVTGSTVQGNTAVGDGGGIYNATGTVAPLLSTIRNNTPNNCAGTPVPGCSG